MANQQDSEAALEKVGTLLAEQSLAALATEQDGHPYANIVAFANTPDLRHLLFITTRPTQKYRNLISNEYVAMLVDSRGNTDADFHEAIAVTAIGQTADISAHSDHDEMHAIFLAKHPYLKDFASSPTTALVRVTVSRYVLVDHFQHVVEIKMTS